MMDRKLSRGGSGLLSMGSHIQLNRAGIAGATLRWCRTSGPNSYNHETATGGCTFSPARPNTGPGTSHLASLDFRIAISSRPTGLAH